MCCFENSFDIHHDIEFTKLSKQFGFHPVYHKGILCAANNPKGKVLKAFFNKINWQPKKVLFFDDEYNNCKSVAKEMKHIEINTQCYWYHAEFNKKKKINQRVMAYQCNHLTQTGEFLTEKEVAEILEKEK